VGGGSASPSIAEISLRRRELPERADAVDKVVDDLGEALCLNI
jgi:hypothetical protein